MNNLATVPTIEAPQLPGAAPLSLVERAVMAGASMEMVERLIAMQERVEANNARKAFDAAIAAAKAEIPVVSKNATGHNSKRYANFAAYAETIDPILGEHGLSYRFRTNQTDRIAVTCVLSHRDGHSEETTLAGPADSSGNKNAIQAIGSTLTYLQRYTLVQALGLAAAEDDDGKAAEDAGAITEEQAEEISGRLVACKADVNGFLSYVGASSISDIPASRLGVALRALEAKERVQQKAKTNG